MLNGFDLDEVGVAGGAVGDAAGHDDLVALAELERLLGDALRMVEQDVDGLELLAQHRDDAPRKGQLIPDLFVRGHTDDVHGHTEARDHPHRPAGQGADDDALCADVDGHAAGGVGDGVEQAVDLEIRLAEALFIVDVLLCFADDGGMVATDCTGYLPAALSPESMTALEPS